jgi:hypothetical protein
MLFLAELERRARPLPRPIAAKRANDISSLEALLKDVSRKTKVMYDWNAGLTRAATRSDWKSPGWKRTEKIPGCEGVCPSAGIEPVVIVNLSSISKYRGGELYDKTRFVSLIGSSQTDCTRRYGFQG